MKRSEKTFVVDELKARIRDAKSFVALDYQGLGVREITRLREMIRGAGGIFIVVKNTLLKLALEGGDKGEVISKLTGPTAIVFSENDEVAPLQAVGKFIKERSMPKLKFGVFGQVFYEQDTLLKLAYLPSRDVLFGQLLATLSSPLHGLLGTLQGNTQKLVYILSEYKNKKGGEQ